MQPLASTALYAPWSNGISPSCASPPRLPLGCVSVTASAGNLHLQKVFQVHCHFVLQGHVSFLPEVLPFPTHSSFSRQLSPGMRLLCVLMFCLIGLASRTQPAQPGKSDYRPIEHSCYGSLQSSQSDCSGKGKNQPCLWLQTGQPVLNASKSALGKASEETEFRKWCRKAQERIQMDHAWHVQ